MPSKSRLLLATLAVAFILSLSLVSCGGSGSENEDLPNTNESLTECGDGALADGEECDDGNVADGDGCSASCAIEVVPDCEDGLKNQDETDVDCGGSNCGDCADGSACAGDDDCLSGVCSAEALCVQPTCGNGLIEAGEDCDGDDQLGDATCETEGFKTGTLLCDKDCQFDTGECSNFLQFCNGQGYPIPDDDVLGVQIPITVDSAGSVKSVGLSYLKITHTFIDDLGIDLKKGAGAVHVMSVGTQCEGNNLEVVVEDAYPTPLFQVCNANNDPAVQGLFRPLTPFGQTFGGVEASGDWVLHVRDEVGADIGTVDNVCLTIEYE